MLNFQMQKIILTTLNSKFTHTSIALRYLYANMAELQESTTIVEFSINDAIQTIAEKILVHNPTIIGIGVYIWNVSQVHELLHILKKISPNTKIILGGPEVSHEPFRVNLDGADYIIQGEGDRAFYELCRALTDNTLPENRIIKMSMPSLKNIELPYKFYTDNDIKHRYIYVEASRGCPFECEFCLSSMDEKVRAFDIEVLLEEFELLWQRGARNFKFIDRTFNLNIKTANRLLDFFLAKEEPYFAHFEVVPDHFPESLKEKIAKFPHGALQLEIGIQTLNPEIANNISRPLKLDKIQENIGWLEQTNVHMHLDLIVGLPGESLESFGANLDKLMSLSSCEIQIGILKKLSGTYINRHDIECGMIYSDIPPYDVLQTSTLSFSDIQIMKRFSRFWDLMYNNGNFKRSVKLIWQDGSVFREFYDFSAWIYAQTDATYKISLQRLGELLFRYLCDVKNMEVEFVSKIMLDDMMKYQGRTIPLYLKPYSAEFISNQKNKVAGFNKRQQ